MEITQKEKMLLLDTAYGHFMACMRAIMKESLDSAAAYGIKEEILDSITEYLTTEPAEIPLAIAITTNVLHSRRRGDEVYDVVPMLAEQGLKNTMSAQAAATLYRLDTLGLKAYFEERIPGNMDDIFDRILAVDKEGRESR